MVSLPGWVEGARDVGRIDDSNFCRCFSEVESLGYLVAQCLCDEFRESSLDADFEMRRNGGVCFFTYIL